MPEPSVMDGSVGELLTRMADPRPGPSAGSAAALAAGLAAALIGKIARLSTRRLPDARELAERADRLRGRAVELADADAAAVVAMLARPDAEADPDAIAVPEEIGDLATELGTSARHLAATVNPWLRADALAAQQLAESAVAIIHEIRRSNAERRHRD